MRCGLTAVVKSTPLLSSCIFLRPSCVSSPAFSPYLPDPIATHSSKKYCSDEREPRGFKKSVDEQPHRDGRVQDSILDWLHPDTELLLLINVLIRRRSEDEEDPAWGE